MLTLSPIEPVDYLVIGHITQDLTPAGPVFGGTVSYAALTARALGLRVGIVTTYEVEKLGFPKVLEGVTIAAHDADATTTFENIHTPAGRIQYLHRRAPTLNMSHVPETWRKTPLVHFGPLAQEIEPAFLRQFPESFIGLTPQGWLREWDSTGRVRLGEWPEARFVLEHANAAVISIEDVQGDENRIEEMASAIRILAVTEGANGARVYWNGDVRSFKAPYAKEVDPVGAGDIFATSFFHRLHTTRDPWEAARFANAIASISVTRRGLDGVPTPAEVQNCLVEIIRG